MGTISLASVSSAVAITVGVILPPRNESSVITARKHKGRDASERDADIANRAVVHQRCSGETHFGNCLCLARAHFPVILPPWCSAARQSHRTQ